MKKRDKYLVLTVDDDELINQILGLRLKELGYAHKSYTNPQDFLVAVKTLEPDLCIVDLNLGQDGVGFLMIQAIRTSLDYHVPIIVISVDSELESISYAMEVGADDYIIKPPKKDVFNNTVHKYLKVDEHLPDVETPKLVPQDFRPSSVTSSIRITHVGEEGFYLLSPMLIVTGVVVTLRGINVQDILGVEAVTVSIAKNWLDRESGEFGLFAEFIDSSREVHETVRKYIKKIAGV